MLRKERFVGSIRATGRIYVVEELRVDIGRVLGRENDAFELEAGLDGVLTKPMQAMQGEIFLNTRAALSGKLIGTRIRRADFEYLLILVGLIGVGETIAEGGCDGLVIGVLVSKQQLVVVPVPGPLPAQVEARVVVQYRDIRGGGLAHPHVARLGFAPDFVSAVTAALVI